jgi:hypothetical protein
MRFDGAALGLVLRVNI